MRIAPVLGQRVKISEEDTGVTRGRSKRCANEPVRLVCSSIIGPSTTLRNSNIGGRSGKWIRGRTPSDASCRENVRTETRDQQRQEKKKKKKKETKKRDQQRPLEQRPETNRDQRRRKKKKRDQKKRPTETIRTETVRSRKRGDRQRKEWAVQSSRITRRILPINSWPSMSWDQIARSQGWFRSVRTYTGAILCRRTDNLTDFGHHRKE